MTNFLTHSRKKWRERGYHVEGTESIVRLPGGVTRRSDLFGFVDLLAVPEMVKVVRGDLEDRWIYLQVTSWKHVPTRIRKIVNETTGNGQWAVPMRAFARSIVARGDRVVVEGWKQKDGPGSRWVSREREITLEDLNV